MPIHIGDEVFSFSAPLLDDEYFVTELLLEPVIALPESVNRDIHIFIDSLAQKPFDQNSLKMYGLKNEDVVNQLMKMFAE